MGCAIRVRPPPIRVLSLFTLTHTRMAQGRAYGPTGAIHVRLLAAERGPDWLASYTYGPSHTCISIDLNFTSLVLLHVCWEVMLSGHTRIGGLICVWAGNSHFLSFFSYSYVVVQFLL